MNAAHAKKIGDAHRGKKKSPEHVANVAASRRGVNRPPSVREKISAALKGRTMSAEHREKIRAALKGRQRSPEHSLNQHNAKVGVPFKVDPEERERIKNLPVATREVFQTNMYGMSNTWGMIAIDLAIDNFEPSPFDRVCEKEEHEEWMRHEHRFHLWRTYKEAA